jgi:hypothetical protein
MTKIVFYVLLACIILFFAYINSLNEVETFTPAINRRIRPHVRRVKKHGNQMITSGYHKARRMVR